MALAKSSKKMFQVYDVSQLLFPGYFTHAGFFGLGAGHCLRPRPFRSLPRPAHPWRPGGFLAARAGLSLSRKR